MTINADSTNMEVINELQGLLVQNEHELLQVKLMVALVASMATLEHRLEEISCYLASIEESLLRR